MLEHRERILRQTAVLKAEREELASLQESSKIIVAGLQGLQQVVDLLDDMTDQELNRAYLRLIDRVFVAGGQDPNIIWL